MSADEQDRKEPKGPPYDLMVVCLLAVCLAVLIGVSAGVVWLRLFGQA